MDPGPDEPLPPPRPGLLVASLWHHHGHRVRSATYLASLLVLSLAAAMFLPHDAQRGAMLYVTVLSIVGAAVLAWRGLVASERSWLPGPAAHATALGLAALGVLLLLLVGAWEAFWWMLPDTTLWPWWADAWNLPPVAMLLGAAALYLGRGGGRAAAWASGVGATVALVVLVVLAGLVLGALAWALGAGW